MEGLACSKCSYMHACIYPAIVHESGYVVHAINSKSYTREKPCRFSINHENFPYEYFE